MGYIGPYGTAEDTGSAPWHNAARDYEPKVDVSYTMGKHAMKFGFSYNRYDKNQQVFGDSQGNFSPSSTTNDALMDLLLGIAGSYSQLNDAPIRHWVNQTPSAYAEDNWHVTPRFSLQLGIRYDALPHAWERNNAQSNFDPSYYNQSEVPIWTAAGHHRSVQPVGSDSEQPVGSSAAVLSQRHSRRRHGRLPARRSGEQVQHLAAPYRVLRGHVRKRQDGSARRLRHVL